MVVADIATGPLQLMTIQFLHPRDHLRHLMTIAMIADLRPLNVTTATAAAILTTHRHTNLHHFLLHHLHLIRGVPQDKKEDHCPLADHRTGERQVQGVLEMQPVRDHPWDGDSSGDMVIMTDDALMRFFNVAYSCQLAQNASPASQLTN
jgi:hypothetical protein